MDSGNLKWIDLRLQYMIAAIPILGGVALITLTYWLLFFNRKKMGHKGGLVFTFIIFPIFAIILVGGLLLFNTLSDEQLSSILTWAFMVILMYLISIVAIQFQIRMVRKHLKDDKWGRGSWL